VECLVFFRNIKLRNYCDCFCNVSLFKSCTEYQPSKRVALDSQPRSGMNLIVGNIQIHNKVVLWNHDSTVL